jgi:hypothetical protein
VRKIDRDKLSRLDKSRPARHRCHDRRIFLGFKAVDVWPEFHRVCIDDLAAPANGAPHCEAGRSANDKQKVAVGGQTAVFPGRHSPELVEGATAAVF